MWQFGSVFIFVFFIQVHLVGFFYKLTFVVNPNARWDFFLANNINDTITIWLKYAILQNQIKQILDSHLSKLQVAVKKFQDCFYC